MNGFRKTYLNVLLLNMVLWVMPVRLSADVHASYTDSLRCVLNQIDTPLQKLPVLMRLSNLCWQQPEEVGILKDIINISVENDKYSIAYQGLAGLCRYYLNAGDGDSLFYWKNQLDSIAKERSEVPLPYYIASNLLCKYYLSQGNYELAMNEAVRILDEAKKMNEESGLMRAYQSLGYVYVRVGRNKDAVVAYREGLHWVRKINTIPTYEMQYLSEMIYPCLRENLLEEAEQLLNGYEDLFTKEAQVFNSKGLDFPLQDDYWFICSYYVELYVKKGELRKAKIYLDKAENFINQSDEALSDDDEKKALCYRARVLYFQAIKNYKQALAEIDKAIEVRNEPDFLRLKIDILCADGQKKEGMALYEELFALNAKINNEAFGRQLTQLRMLNELNNQERRARELEYQNEQLAMRNQQLILAMGIFLVLLFLLYVLSRYYIRSRRLKDALLAENNLLVRSEKLLRVAKEEAEEANKLKTRLSRISVMRCVLP